MSEWIIENGKRKVRKTYLEKSFLKSCCVLRISIRTTIYCFDFTLGKDSGPTNQRTASRLLTISMVTKFPSLSLFWSISLEDDIQSTALGFNCEWPRKAIPTVRTKMLISCHKLKRTKMGKYILYYHLQQCIKIKRELC